MIEEIKFVADSLIFSGPMFILWGGEEYGFGLIVAGVVIHGYVRMIEWLSSAFDQEPL